MAVMQAMLPLGSYNPADPIVLEVSVVGKGAMWSLGQAQWENHNAVPCGSGPKTCLLQQRTPDVLLSPSGSKTPGHGHQVTM